MIEQGPLAADQWVVPSKPSFEGRFCKLELLNEKHFEDLRVVRTVEDAAQRYKYLFSVPPLDKEGFAIGMQRLVDNPAFVTYAVIDKRTGTAEGIQSYMNINTTHGTVEIGGILWGPRISRTPVTTEAFYLFTSHAFDDLRYRRYEWKCNNLNAPSKSAALRFGFQFEGIFRQHMIQNGFSRDSAYFSMLDIEWPLLKQAFEKWLDPSNFNENGAQISDLKSIRESITSESI